MAEKIGAYEIQQVLGQGGMAIVYKAFHPELERTVAIKLMLGNLESDPTFLARFQREARSAARMQHPNIVTVYDYGTQDRKPYLVMEYVSGGSLADALRDGALPPPQAVMYIAQIA